MNIHRVLLVSVVVCLLVCGCVAQSGSHKPGMPNAFGVATASFPVKAVLGKHIQYSGYFKA